MCYILCVKIVGILLPFKFSSTSLNQLFQGLAGGAVGDAEGDVVHNERM